MILKNNMEEQELNKITGLINYIKVTKEGEKFGKKWKLYSIKLDSSETFYSAFGNEDNDPYCHYSTGDNVLLESIKKGEYNNIKSIKLYNLEAENKFEEYVNNPLKKEIVEPIQEIINNGIFSGEFNINGIIYEVNITKK